MVCICPSDFLTSRRAFPGPPSPQRAEVGCHRVSGSYRNDLNIRQRSQPRLGTADAFPDASKRNCAEQCRGRGRKWVVEQHTGKQRLASFLEVPVRYRESPYLMNLVRDTSNRGGFSVFILPARKPVPAPCVCCARKDTICWGCARVSKSRKQKQNTAVVVVTVSLLVWAISSVKYPPAG